MKHLFLLLLFSLLFGCSHAKISPQNSLLCLKKAKAYTDNYLKLHENDLIVLVKSPGKTEPISVKNNNCPDSIDYTLNILNDSEGKIMFIALIPYSESGDWNVKCQYYFDKQGNMYAFYKEESVFAGEDGSSDVVRDLLVKYYDSDFNIINSKNWITDMHYKKIMGNTNNFDFPDFKYRIYKNLDQFLAAYHIH